MRGFIVSLNKLLNKQPNTYDYGQYSIQCSQNISYVRWVFYSIIVADGLAFIGRHAIRNHHADVDRFMYVRITQLTVKSLI